MSTVLLQVIMSTASGEPYVRTYRFCQTWLCMFVVQDMSTLLAQRRKLKLEATGLCASRRDRKRKSIRVSNQWCLTRAMKHTAITCYIVSDYDPSAAAQYLAAVGRQRHWHAVDMHNLAIMVEDLFLQINGEELSSLLEFEECCDVARCREALKYAQEYYVVRRTRMANADMGVAPSSELPLQWARQVAQRFPEPCRPKQLFSVRDRVSKKWLRKLRLRWGGKVRVLPASAPVPQEEFKQKALLAHFQGSCVTACDIWLDL